jgi:hypothetical protein
VRQRFLALLWQGDLTPAEIVARLNLPPRRLRTLLASGPFRNALKLMRTVERSRQEIILTRTWADAIARLTELAKGEGETARKACLDLLALRRETDQADLTPPPQSESGGFAARGRDRGTHQW